MQRPKAVTAHFHVSTYCLWTLQNTASQRYYQVSSWANAVLTPTGGVSAINGGQIVPRTISLQSLSCDCALSWIASEIITQLCCAKPEGSKCLLQMLAAASFRVCAVASLYNSWSPYTQFTATDEYSWKRDNTIRKAICMPCQSFRSEWNNVNCDFLHIFWLDSIVYVKLYISQIIDATSNLFNYHKARWRLATLQPHFCILYHIQH